ncbi:MAG: Rieske 2Fe-2S domain-containing protein, partial [Anaerolineales bacterium]|nr:Rieske 2Fe-2S domain-containing protein [Anaerolineales bacterium]
MAVRDETLVRQKLKEISLSRRAFLKVSLIASGVLTSWGIFRFLGYQQPVENPVRLALMEAEAYPVGSVTSVPQLKAWLLRDETGLYALSAVCSHLGCTISETDTGFECPCHGSRFYLKGTALQGPAVKQLEYLELSLTEENL